MALIRINLLPRNLRKRVEPGWWRVLAAGVPILALVVMGALQVSSQSELSRINGDIAENKLTIEKLQPQIALQRSLTAEQASLQTILNTARALKPSGTPWSADLARFTSRIPVIGDGSTIALTTLTMTQPKMVFPGKTTVKEFVLAGKARSSAALSSFIRTFEENSDTAIAFQSATKDAAPAATAGAATPSNSDWTFSATVGLTADATPIAVSTPATGTPNDPNAAPGSAPAPVIPTTTMPTTTKPTSATPTTPAPVTPTAPKTGGN